jgi:Mor family transcriptional regulator
MSALFNMTGRDTDMSADSFYAVKRSRKSVSLEIKHKIIYLADSGESNTEIARKLQLPRTTVVTILKDKARILETVRCQIPLHAKYIPRQGKRDCVKG